MATDAWTTDGYLGSINADLIDDNARTQAKRVRERLIQGGHRFAFSSLPIAVTNDEHDGKHAVGWETSTPAHSDAGHLTLAWDFAGTTALMRLYGSTHATLADQLDVPGDILLPAGGRLFGTATAAWKTSTGDQKGPWTSGGYSNIVYYKSYSGTGAAVRTLTAVFAAKLFAATSTITFEIRHRDASAGETATGLSFTDDANSTAVGTVAIATGDFTKLTTGLSVTLDPDDELVIKILSGPSLISTDWASFVFFLE